MSVPSLPPVDFATGWSHAPIDRPVEDFLEKSMAMLEERLADVCSELGHGLGGLADVLARAVGTEGRGGRRWRPLLTLAAAEAFGGRKGEALDAAVAVELTHTASLVLDDLPCMDDAPLRRGQPATHRLVGSAGAILVSVGLLAHAVELVGRHPRWGGRLCDEWGRMVGLRGMAGGQAMDVSSPGQLRGAARRLHREKSTALPAFALSAGARIAGADDAALVGVEAFGRAMGWSYQLLDDVRDLDEDTRNGVALGGILPLSQSRRIMQRAYRVLRGLPGLCDDGLEILLGLAGRVVIPEDGTCSQRSDEARTRGF
jgi:geranylgeranyl diphosphate synthase type II